MFVPLLERDLKGISRGEVLATLQRILSKQRRIVGHNLKYDALLLRRHGLTIRNIYFDTMLAAYDCFGDWDFFNLGFLVEKLLGKRIKRYSEIVRRDQTFLDLPLKEYRPRQTTEERSRADYDARFAIHEPSQVKHSSGC